jgi:hypothetical protein
MTTIGLTTSLSIEAKAYAPKVAPTMMKAKKVTSTIFFHLFCGQSLNGHTAISWNRLAYMDFPRAAVRKP